VPADRRRPLAFLVTCEHGGNRVPPAYRRRFEAHRALLSTHRAYDPGSLALAREIATALRAPLVESTVTRLLVDLNRSLHHPRLFSEIIRPLPPAERERIVERHWRPYRDEVEARIAAATATGRCLLHVSSHSFTPVLDGEVRNADIGLLYDPRRRPERELAARWRQALKARAPAVRVRMNYPYAGRADGLTTHLRQCFPASRYAGVELEINQRHVLDGGRAWTDLRRTVRDALMDILR